MAKKNTKENNVIPLPYQYAALQREKKFPYSTSLLSISLDSSESTFNPHPIPFSLSPVQEDAVSSETENSDRALKPGPRSNLLHPERRNARDEAADGRAKSRVMVRDALPRESWWDIM